MNGPRRGARGRAAAALLLLALGGELSAQYSESDPRFVKDPRTIPDPRQVPKDPRVVEQDPSEVPEGRELFDFLLASGDDGRLRVAMVENPWIVLPYIDEACNRRLVMTEAGTATTETGGLLATDLEQLVLRLATLADGGLQDTRLVPYVTARLAWTPEQVLQWRESQARFVQARTIFTEALDPADLQRAMTPLEQSVQAARVLGDVAGQTRGLALMGRIRADLGQAPEAGTLMREVLRLGRPIRDFDSVWEALSVLYESAIDERRWQDAREVLRDQYLIAQDSGDAAATDGVLSQLLHLEDFLRRHDQPLPGGATPVPPGALQPPQVPTQPGQGLIPQGN